MTTNDSLPILDLIDQEFATSPLEPNLYSPLTLAYIGDAVYDLIIRTILVEKANSPVKKLHRRACEVVKAGSQAALILIIEDILTEEELHIYKRGRNAKASSVAKNADIHDYRNATGFEALVGYLYLTGQLGRAMNLIKTGFDRLNMEV